MTNKIREIRKRRALSQQALGARIGFSKMKVSRQERGQRSVPLADLYAYARALDCHPAELIDDRWAMHADEMRIVAIYRHLDDAQRSVVRSMVEGLAIAPEDDTASPLARSA